jgi:hypothetical protein
MPMKSPMAQAVSLFLLSLCIIPIVNTSTVSGDHLTTKMAIIGYYIACIH